MVPDNCPLTEAQVRLLQTSIANLTLHEKRLAKLLCVSPHTIHTHFRDINEALGVHSGYEAALLSLHEGWTRMLPEAFEKIPRLWYGPTDFDMLELSRERKRRARTMSKGVRTMLKTSYFCVNGEYIGESSNGVRTDYITDGLGSVVGTVHQNAQVVNTYRYKPFGGLLAKTGVGPDPKLRWVGAHGYRQTNNKYADVHIMRRHDDTTTGRWTTRDPIARETDAVNAYTYALQRPTVLIDPTGLKVDVTNCDRNQSVKQKLDKACGCVNSLTAADWQKINACILKYRRAFDPRCETLSKADQACMRQFCGKGCGELHCSWNEDCHGFWARCASDCVFCNNTTKVGCGMGAWPIVDVFTPCTTVIICASNMNTSQCACPSIGVDPILCTVFHELNHICNWDPQPDGEHKCSELTGMCMEVVCRGKGFV